MDNKPTVVKLGDGNYGVSCAEHDGENGILFRKLPTPEPCGKLNSMKKGTIIDLNENDVFIKCESLVSVSAILSALGTLSGLILDGITNNKEE